MECGVCMMEWDDKEVIPQNLPCGHTYCQNCLKQLWKAATKTIECPNCRKAHKIDS